MRRKSGVILLEVMLALAIVSVAGASLLALAASSGDTMTHAIYQDERMAKAAAFLSVVSLWPREDLDRRLGARAQGDWILTIHRNSPGLYDVALVERATGQELLRSAFFRPEGLP